MNNPAAKLGREIALTAELGFDYLELTVEPPQAAAATLDAGEVRRQLSDRGLTVVGHTAFYLPIADPFPRVRQAAIDQLRADFDFLAAVGCPFVTVHPCRGVVNGFTEAERLDLQADSYAALVAHAEPLGLQVLCENIFGYIGDPDRLKQHLFDRLPQLGLNLDIAHAFIGERVTRFERFFELLRDRLTHVHLSDNDGLSDQHQPVGAVRLPLKDCLARLRASGYDQRITLEVFSATREYVALSRELVRRWWDEAS